MRGIRNLLGAAVLALGFPLAMAGCDGVVSPEAKAEGLLSLQAIEATVDLSGTWILNEDESDDPGPRKDGAPPHGNGNFPGGSLEPPMGGGGLAAMDRLTIEQVDGSVTLTDRSGRSRTLHPNGEWTTVGDGSGNVQVRASWEEHALRVEIRGHRGQLTRTYELGDDGNQLHITSRIEDGPRGGPVAFTRVYDRETMD